MKSKAGLKWFKGEEATRVEIVNEMKKCSRLKDFLISMFNEIFSPYKHVLVTLFRKQETNFPRL